ncbi:flagellar hook-associated protein 3 [Arcobacter sp. FWKO B]|uniref:flagellin N-terminal helical domain-containing protein n=1 Tax=Arcobacter sp. FWKO B TaxID=2593672 RepID=UPI0018A34771|nr:flagellar hook-associated protein 3 [Arcobacter sp. FWKO B]QOG11999.1 flagellar hook-associated protein 3 [Arcobacter sp. FWKO B]
MINLSDQMMYRLGNLNEEYRRVSYQMSSGKILERGSDDSVIFSKELHINDRIRTYDGLKNQIEKTTAYNNVSDISISQIKSGLEKVQTEVLKSLNAGMDMSDKKALATSLEGIRDNIYTLLNETVDGEYLFSGSDTTIQPFKKAEGFDQIGHPNYGKVEYQGDAILRQIAVAPNSYRDRGVHGFDIMFYTADSAIKNGQLNFNATDRVVDGNGLEWKVDLTDPLNPTLQQYDINGNPTASTLALTDNGDGTYTTETITQNGLLLEAKRNFFDDLHVIISALNGYDKDGNAITDPFAQNDIVREKMDTIKNAYDASNIAHAKLGARNNIFNSALENVQTQLTHFNILYQETAGADLAKLAMESKALEMTYSALYTTISKMNDLSLIKFIR